MSMAKAAHAARHGKNRNTKEGRYAKRRRNEGDQEVSWATVDSLALAGLVIATTDAGDAVTFARTSDGGALSLTILSGDDRIKEYYASSEEAEKAVRQLAALATAETV